MYDMLINLLMWVSFAGTNYFFFRSNYYKSKCKRRKKKIIELEKALNDMIDPISPKNLSTGSVRIKETDAA